MSAPPKEPENLCPRTLRYVADMHAFEAEKYRRSGERREAAGQPHSPQLMRMLAAALSVYAASYRRVAERIERTRKL